MTVEGHNGPGAGSFDLGAVVNPYGIYQELSAANNASAGAPLAFTAPPTGY